MPLDHPSQDPSLVAPPPRARLALLGGPLLELRGVSRSWRVGADGCHAQLRALAHVDLTLAAGELVGLAGEGGAGKTTLLLCAAGIVRPDTGSVTGAAVGRVAYVGPGDGEWARRAVAAVERGARALLLDVLDAPAFASPRAVAALAGSAAGAGLAVVVASRDTRALPAFATRIVALREGRLVSEAARMRAPRPVQVAERRAR